MRFAVQLHASICLFNSLEMKDEIDGIPSSHSRHCWCGSRSHQAYCCSCRSDFGNDSSRGNSVPRVQVVNRINTSNPETNTMGFFTELLSKPYSKREQRDVPGIGAFIRSTGRFRLCFSCNGMGSRFSICEHCNQVGAHHGLCNRCTGTGSILFPAIPCPTCDGSARVLTQECKRCAGIGHLPASAASCKKCNGEGIYSKTCQECSGNGQIRLICQECNSSGLIRF